MTFGLTDADLFTIIAILRSFPEIEKTLIFGSRAMGNYKPGSDIDLALIGAIPHDIVVKVKSELEEKTNLPYFFDVVRVAEDMNEELKAHIDQYGKAIYSRG